MTSETPELTLGNTISPIQVLAIILAAIIGGSVAFYLLATRGTFFFSITDSWLIREMLMPFLPRLQTKAIITRSTQCVEQDGEWRLFWFRWSSPHGLWLI